MGEKLQITELDKLIEEYSTQINAISTSFKDRKESAFWKIKLNLIKIEFVFTKKDSVECPASTLFCRIYLQNNSYTSYHIPEIVDFLELDDFHCYYFPYIENVERFKACFDFICNFINQHLEDINSLAADAEKWENKKCEIIKKVCGIKDENIPKDEMQKKLYFDFLFANEERLFLSRFTRLSAYRLFLSGNYEKAIIKYRKVKGLFPYEKKLIYFMRALEKPFEAIPEKCNSKDASRHYFGSLEDLFSYVFSWITSDILVSVPFITEIIILNALYGTNGNSLSVWYAFLLSALPGLLLGIIYKNRIIGTVFKKRRGAREFDDILSPEFSRFSIKIIVGILIVSLMILLPFLL